MRQGNAGVVGMPCVVKAADDTMIARAIAAAVSHPFGIGDAKYRLRDSGPMQEAVDTVAFACFRKSLWAELGGFNESLLTNEDYDFNYRVRCAGWDVILDRTGHCDYFARGTLKSLAKQYWRYGKWKAQMIRRQPGSTRIRHLVAPAFVSSLVLLSVFGAIWPPAWLLLLVELAIYFLAALVAGSQVARRNRSGLGLTLFMPIVFATIHLTWGTSFLLGLFGRVTDRGVVAPAVSS
jgi:GT2 family glycosyltransferase